MSKRMPPSGAALSGRRPAPSSVTSLWRVRSSAVPSARLPALFWPIPIAGTIGEIISAMIAGTMKANTNMKGMADIAITIITMTRKATTDAISFGFRLSLNLV
ncbi:MAG TPA: hypothetical protein VNH42_04960 [Mariprofundaceae bacterium]|nr:hypothetical protein [Mariprofundaceae bacterium]